MVAEIKASINPDAVLRYGNVFLWINRPLARLRNHFVLRGLRHVCNITVILLTRGKDQLRRRDIYLASPLLWAVDAMTEELGYPF
jgi:hypothetical protein